MGFATPRDLVRKELYSILNNRGLKCHAICVGIILRHRNNRTLYQHCRMVQAEHECDVVARLRSV